MDSIRTRSHRAKRCKLTPVEEGTFESLPVDIFHLLFPYLEPHERLALSITCKTMHAVERLIGGWTVELFDKIEAKTNHKLHEHAIKTESSTKKKGGSTSMIPIAPSEKNEKSIFRNAAIFQRAFAERLDLEIDSQLNGLSFIFAFTQFKELKARVSKGPSKFFPSFPLPSLPSEFFKPQWIAQKCDPATRFLATFLKRQSQNNIEVDIEWKCCDHSFLEFREAIKGLKSLRKIKLDWEVRIRDDYKNRDYPIDDSGLRYLVENSRECSVGIGNISALCILEAFEICFNSTDRDKKVELLTEESTIAKLRRLVRASAHQGYYWEHNERDSRLRRGDGRNCTCAIIEEPPFYPGGEEFIQSRGEGYPYRRVTISRVPPLWNARRTAY